MAYFHITSDSTCDLSDALIKQHDIQLLPLGIFLGNNLYHDNVDIDAKRVIEYVDETGVLPKTSATSTQEYIDFFKEIGADGHPVLHFSISSGASSCYDHARLAAQELDNVYVVDSLQLSSGQGLLVLKAADFRASGMDVKECYEKILELAPKARTSFVLDRLDFLHKGGRCSLTKLIGARILKIHPHISMRDGSLKFKKSYQGNLLRGVGQYVADLAAEYTDYDKTRVFITHCFADEAIVERVKERVKELFDFDEIIETHAGTTITSHCGRNCIGVLFIAE